MTEEMIEKTNDSELIMLYHENDEDAKNILFLKYKFIIDILINKHKALINKLNVDWQEVYSECTVGFSDGLRNFQDNKDATLPSFITLCIERRLGTLLKKYSREKYKVINDTYSLDYVYNQFSRPLVELLTDNSFEPLDNMTERENYSELIKNIRAALSKKENDVFDYIIKGFDYNQIAKILNNTPKQIDNTIQRIKQKIKNVVLKQK